MRGIDCRAPVKGVTLVITKSFSCQRNADQGLLRVGRYGDPCSRYTMEGVRLVDPKLETALHKKLYLFSRSRKPRSNTFSGTPVTGEIYEEAARKQAIKAARKE